MSKNISSFFGIVMNVFLAVIVILAVALLGARLVGYQTYTVLSGSMDPTYSTGSIIYVKELAPEELEVNDPISFTISENTVVTHRIIEVLPDEDHSETIYFRTKGDANKSADGELVRSENVLGKVVFSIPLLGFVLHYLAQSPGKYLVIAGALLLVFLSILPEILGENNNGTK